MQIEKPISEKKILARINNGIIDEKVMAFLYGKSQKPILDYILRNNGSKEDSNDIFHDSLISFIALIKKKEENIKKNNEAFEDIEKVIHLLKIIAKRKWIDKLRKRRNEESIDRLISKNHGIYDTPDDFISENHTIDDTPNEEQIIFVIRRALEQISPICRDELERFYLSRGIDKESDEEFKFNLSKHTRYDCLNEFKKIVKKMILKDGL